MRIITTIVAVVVVLLSLFTDAFFFTTTFHSKRRRRSIIVIADKTPPPRPPLRIGTKLSASELTPEQELTLAKIPTKFSPLFSQALKATIPRPEDNSRNAHDPFRFEWGTWVDEEALLELMKRVDEIQSVSRIFDEKLFPDWKVGNDAKGRPKARRFRVACGTKWDCIIYALPSNVQYEGRCVTGSWTVLKALTGVVEVAMLREDRDGNLKKVTKKNLRGGSDGGSAIGGGGSSISGEECIKYVGGPLRSYMGKSERSILLEFVIRPPVSSEDASSKICNDWDLEKIDELLDIVVPPEVVEDEDNDTDQGSSDNIVSTQGKTAQQQAQNLGKKLGMDFDKVGGLDAQLDTIVRRVLASRANPEAARRLGISHVRGILLYGPPGCGKTLLARELARLLGAREPQIVNGPEILDKFIGEAEKRVRDLFTPAELEYAQVGDDSALHIIILDEMDAIARKRGSASSDTTGVRDSVVNQLLAKMDGVKEANNVLVVGMTNRPELLDPALLRPGRLEVQLRVELPDVAGRRDIFRIHTRRMRDSGGISQATIDMIEDLSEKGLPAKTEKFTGAEIAGLVRSAASFALARSVQSLTNGDDITSDIEKKSTFLDSEEGKVSIADFESALEEVRPALGKQDSVLKMRMPNGIIPYSPAVERIMRDLKRFTAPVTSDSRLRARLNSMLLVGSGSGGAGVTALGAWAGSEASSSDSADYVRLVTALDLISGEGSGGEAARAAALMDKFSEAREMQNSLLILDDIDQLCAGSGADGYSTVMISTLRALLRTPPESSTVTKSESQSISTPKNIGRSMHIIATTSRSDAACRTLYELFEETIVVPLLSDVDSVIKLLVGTCYEEESSAMAKLIINKVGRIGAKSVLRLAERASASAEMKARLEGKKLNSAQDRITALENILEDLQGDAATASNLCEVL